MAEKPSRRGTAPTSRRYSTPPVSGHLFSPAALRTYRDPELLDRVWVRLRTKSLSQQRWGRRAQIAAAAALFIMGIGVGRLTITEADAESEATVVASEQVVSAPLAARRQAVPPQRRQQEPETVPQGTRGADRQELSRRYQVVQEESDRPLDAVEERDSETLPVEQSTPIRPESPQWLLLAERGDFAAAFSELDHRAGFDVVLEQGSAEELMTLADVARFAGRQGRAIQALRQVTQRYRSDPNAPLAAMMLGNLLSRAGDRGGAARAYALNRTLSPGGDFAEDALVREFDLALSARNFERATQLFSQYEQEFPKGSRLEAMRAEVEQLAAQMGVPWEPATAPRPPDFSTVVNPYEEHADPSAGDAELDGEHQGAAAGRKQSSERGRAAEPPQNPLQGPPSQAAGEQEPEPQQQPASQRPAE